MKIVAFILFVIVPGSLLAQEVDPEAGEFQTVVPSNLVEWETERSRMCVPVLARLADLDARLEPLAERAERLGRLEAAIAVEDSARVSPFDESDPVELAVRDWFIADEELGRRYAEGEEEVQEERRRAREATVQELRDTFEEVNTRAQEVLEAEADLQESAPDCQSAIFVRPVVLEVCDEGVASPICQEAREPQVQGLFRFVEAPEDLWDVEQMRPWTDPSVLRPAPGGGLAGARTSSLVRRGNVTVVVALEPMIRERAQLDETQAAEFDAHLDSLGFAFDDPRFVMAPALAVELDIGRPLAGETHYFLHFGNLSDPARDVIWVAPSGGRGPIRGVASADEEMLLRLASGEEVNLTAIRIIGDLVEGDEMEALEGEALFSLGLPMVGQTEAVTALVGYMGGGQLAADLSRLFPPQEGGGGGR